MTHLITCHLCNAQLTTVWALHRGVALRAAFQNFIHCIMTDITFRKHQQHPGEENWYESKTMEHQLNALQEDVVNTVTNVRYYEFHC